MRLYVDIDDVLCETARTLCGLAERLFDCHVAYEDVYAFNLQDVFQLSDAEMAQFLVASHTPENLMSYPVTPGAVEGLCQLRAHGVDIDIITGRPAAAHTATRAWLDRVGLADFHVEYVNKYDRAYSHRPDEPPTLSRSELLARSYDWALDDSPQILQVLAQWPHTQIVVFDRPWNRHYALKPNMTRVRDWAEVQKVICPKPQQD